MNNSNLSSQTPAQKGAINPMTYLVGIGTVILQIALAVHVARTRKPFIWIFVIFLFPLLGSVVYILAVLVPELERTNAIQTWVSNIERALSETFSRR
jgi:hypothetical protein